MKIGILRASVAAAVTFLVAVSPAAGQALSFSFSGSGTSGNHNANGSGTGTFAAAAAAINLTGGSWDNGCNSFLQLSFALNVNATDTLTFSYAAPLPTDLSSTKTSFTSANPLTVTAGTGAYAGKTGTGNATIFVNLTSSSAFTFTLNGTVTLAAGTPAPLAVVTPNGIVPVFSDATSVQPGSWISIYGNNLANATTLWNGDFPTSLGNVTVSIDGKLGYLWFVSAGQINLQAPDDTTQGCVPVVITTPNGTLNLSLDLRSIVPSFSLLDGTYVAAVILTPDGTGAYGGGTYDLAGPVGRFTYKTRPVKRGETIELFGVGFGPTKTPVPAGKTFSGAAGTAQIVQVYLNKPNGPSTQAPVSFAGMVGAGLYQINVTVPANTPTGDLNVAALVGPPGSQTNVGTSPDLNILLPVQ